MSNNTLTLESKNDKAVCRMCGKAYPKLGGQFYKSYNGVNKGVGYFPYCKGCMDNIYETYIKQGADMKTAVRLMCRKFDIYWDEELCKQAYSRPAGKSLFASYLPKTNTYRLIGKGYEDTLIERGQFYEFGDNVLDTNIPLFESQKAEETEPEPEPELKPEIDEDSLYEVSDDTKTMWGPGYTNKMYSELEDRRQYWIDNLTAKGVDTDDVGVQALLRQIVAMELDINKSRAAGDDVDKKVNTLNTLIGSAMLKPTQKKETNTDSALENTPFGVWIRRWEDNRPIPEPDPELQDVDGVIKFLSIWFLGHLCSMLNIKNSYCKLYEDKLAEMRIERPEFDDEDNETMFNDIFGSAGGDEGD